MTAKKAKAPTSGHKEGSRKGRVHELFNKEGQDAAWTLGLKLKLSPNTLRAWFGTWRRAAEPVKKRAANKTATPKSTKTAAASSDQPETIPVFLQG